MYVDGVSGWHTLKLVLPCTRPAEFWMKSIVVVVWLSSLSGLLSSGKISVSGTCG